MNLLNKNRLCTAIAAVTLGALGTISARSEGASVVQGSVFTCPSGTGLCKWTQKRWQKFWAPTSGIPVVDFRETSSGRVVIYEAGHLGSGALRILDKEGRTLLVRSLEGGHDLDELVGESTTGSLLACSDTACDLWLPEGLDDPIPRLPSGCLTPRFFREGQVACRDKETQIVVKSPNGGDLQNMQLPLPNILDWLPLNQGAFLLRDPNAIYAWQPGRSPEKLSTMDVQWAGAARGQAYFSECHSGPDFSHLQDCALYGITPDLKTELIWKSGPIAASRVAAKGDHLLVEARGNGKRQLEKVRKVVGAWRSYLLWSGETEPGP